MRIPASFTGTVGLRPTPGLVPVGNPSTPTPAPLPPPCDETLAHLGLQDVAGPMARGVRDVGMLLDAMSGPDPYGRDPLSLRYYYDNRHDRVREREIYTQIYTHTQREREREREREIYTHTHTRTLTQESRWHPYALGVSCRLSPCYPNLDPNLDPEF